MRRIKPDELEGLSDRSMVMDRDFDVYIKMDNKWFYARGGGIDEDHEDDPMEDLYAYEPLYLLRDCLDVLPMEQSSRTQGFSIGTSSHHKTPKEEAVSIIVYEEVTTFFRREVPPRVWDWIERVVKAHRQYERNEPPTTA